MNVVNLNNPTYFAFDPEVYNGYLFGVEKLEDMLAEFRKNAESHWDETEVLYRQAQGNPNYAAYIQLEKEGKFATFTIRHQETMALVGHICFYIYESMHTVGVMEAREDAFFINKDHRGGRLAHKIYDYAENCFPSMGVKQVTMSCKAPAGGPDLDKFLRRKGFNPVATAYFKSLEENDDGIMQRSTTAT